MEWNGINLNGYHQTAWRKQTTNALLLLLMTILFSAFSAYFIDDLSETKKTHSDSLFNEIQQRQAFKTDIKNKIDNLKQAAQHSSARAKIAKGETAQIVQFLKTIPIEGGIEQVIIKKSNHTQILLIGNIAQPAFEKLEGFIKSSQLNYQITQLKADNPHQFQFSLLIDWNTNNESMVK